MRARNSDGQYHNLIASATGIKFESDNRGTRTTLWEAATKSDLPNVKISDLDSVRFNNSPHGPQMAFYTDQTYNGAIFFNIHIQQKELEITRHNGTDWETLFKIQGS